MLQIASFHDHALVILTLVISVTAYALFILITNDKTCTDAIDSQLIEAV
jgi:hypothetical protein